MVTLNEKWNNKHSEYVTLHNWVRQRKPRPETCEICGQKLKLGLANISGQYKWDVNDYKWACLACNKSRLKTPEHRFSQWMKEYTHRIYPKYKELHTRWYQQNKPQIQKQKKLRYILNIEEEHKKRKIYRSLNKEKIREQNRIYRLKYADKIKARKREYYHRQARLKG